MTTIHFVILIISIYWSTVTCYNKNNRAPVNFYGKKFLPKTLNYPEKYPDEVCIKIGLTENKICIYNSICTSSGKSNVMKQACENSGMVPTLVLKKLPFPADKIKCPEGRIFAEHCHMRVGCTIEMKTKIYDMTCLEVSTGEVRKMGEYMEEGIIKTTTQRRWTKTTTRVRTTKPTPAPNLPQPCKRKCTKLCVPYLIDRLLCIFLGKFPYP